jgi:hypothetical protein
MSFNTTDKQLGDGIIKDVRCLLKGAFVTTNGSSDATLTIYDNTAPSGKNVRQFVIPSTQRYGGFFYKEGLEIDNGIYCTISGTGAAYWIDWDSLF